jgi:hypothetical protein
MDNYISSRRYLNLRFIGLLKAKMYFCFIPNLEIKLVCKRKTPT